MHVNDKTHDSSKHCKYLAFSIPVHDVVAIALIVMIAVATVDPLKL
jgi:hypothetical protein